MKTNLTENLPVGSRTTTKHGIGGNVETENNTDRRQKSILIIDTPTECIECQFHRVFADNKPTETWCLLAANRNEDGVNTRAEWCPLRHPLKEVSSDFYIYDRKYLFDNLEREIDLLKGAKAFEEFMKAREKE